MLESRPFVFNWPKLTEYRFQMIFLKTICKKSPGRACRDLLRIPAMMAAPWTRPWPRWVSTTETLSDAASSLHLPSAHPPSGAESRFPGLRSQMFPSGVEKSGLHLLRDARPEIRHRAEQGCPDDAAPQKHVTPLICFPDAILSVISCSRAVLVGFWPLSKPLC